MTKQELIEELKCYLNHEPDCKSYGFHRMNYECGQTVCKHFECDCFKRTDLTDVIALIDEYQKHRDEERILIVLQFCINSIGGLRYSADPLMGQYNHGVDRAIEVLESLKQKKAIAILTEEEKPGCTVCDTPHTTKHIDIERATRLARSINEQESKEPDVSTYCGKCKKQVFDSLYDDNGGHFGCEE